MAHDPEFVKLARKLAAGSFVTDALAHFLGLVVEEVHEKRIKPLLEQLDEARSAMAMIQAAAVDRRGEDFNLTTEQWARFHAVLEALSK